MVSQDPLAQLEPMAQPGLQALRVQEVELVVLQAQRALQALLVWEAELQGRRVSCPEYRC